MTITVSYTNVRYSHWVQDENEPNIARKSEGEINIYDGRVTSARIAREIPKGSTLESTTRVDRKFEVDGEKAIAWLTENGTEKE